MIDIKEAENTLTFTSKILTQFIDEKEKALAEACLSDFRDNPEKYKGYELYFMNRDTLKDALRKAQMFEDMQQKFENAIIPKFKIGQEVWIINTDYFYKKDWFIEKHKVVGINFKFDARNNFVKWYQLQFGVDYYKTYKYLEKNIFATKAEAAKRLAELKGGVQC